jgi:hypothetical protein
MRKPDFTLRRYHGTAGVMERRSWVFLAAGVLFAVPAHASAVVYPQGSFARASEEKALVVWDERTKTEHLVRALSLKGEAETFGVLLATPTLPTIAKEHDDDINRVAKLFATSPGTGPGTVDVLQRTQLGDFEAVTVKASDERALGDWLAKSHFVDKPAMRTWVKGYVDKGWYVTAVRASAKGAGDRKLDVPTIRLSFKTDAPIFPYSEAPVDDADETTFRSNKPHQPYQKYSYGMRLLDVYVIADRQMQMVSGQNTAGPSVADAMRVSAETLAAAIGDTKAWGFDAKSRPTWVVTHLGENVWQRTTQADLAFQTYDLPRPRPGPGVTEVDDRPVGPTYPQSSVAWLNDPVSATTGSTHHKKVFRLGALALFLLIAAAVGFAILSEQRK